MTSQLQPNGVERARPDGAARAGIVTVLVRCTAPNTVLPIGCIAAERCFRSHSVGWSFEPSTNCNRKRTGAAWQPQAAFYAWRSNFRKQAGAVQQR